MAINKITSAPTPNAEIDKINELVDGVNGAGTVKKVNNTSPDSNGNVTISIPDTQIQSDWNQTTTTAKDYIKNKPTIPTVNNATLTIQKNGTTVKTFTANASSNVTANITVPTKTSELTNDSGYTTNTGTVTSVNNVSPVNGNVTISIPSAVTESTVSGWGFTKNAGTVTSVNNVSPTNGNVTLSIPAAQVQSNWNETNTSSKAYIQNKPTIPTVNNATLTITQSGVSKGTFTANASSNVTIALDGGGSNIIGQIIQSAIPLTDSGLHLLDGALIQGSGTYSAFVTYISGLVSSYPGLFVTEANWQASVTQYGTCGKFVYDSTNNTVRLPKITGFVEGTTDVAALGDLVEAGIPFSWLSHTHSRGTMNITGTFFGESSSESYSYTGAFYRTNTGNKAGIGDSDSDNYQSGFDASRSWTGSTSTPSYSDSSHSTSTVQPQSIKVLYYIVIATTTKTEIEVDIDEIATDLNGKADVDGSNMLSSVKNFDGQWVYSSLTLENAVSQAVGDNTKSFDLSSYLPNDGYNYEVLLSADGYTGPTSGATILVSVRSGIITSTNYLVYRSITRTNSYAGSGGTATIPIGADRLLYRRANVGTTASGNTYLRLHGYRRLGTNS